MKLYFISIIITNNLICLIKSQEGEGGGFTFGVVTDNSSEFVFSPEKKYVNDDDIKELHEFDTRGPEIPPFDSEEREANKELPPIKKKFKQAKEYLKKLFKYDQLVATTPRDKNATTTPGIFKRLHHYIRYTLLKRPTPNATTATTPVDDLSLYSKHYTDWKYWNNLHFEIMNESVPERHWFYRKLLRHYAMIDDDDQLETTTLDYIDPHRMDGFSTNVTMATTEPNDPYEDDDQEKIEGHEDFTDPDEPNEITLRPEFERVLDDAINRIKFPVIPTIAEPVNVTYFVKSDIYKRIQQKLFSFYAITTADPEDFMHSYEVKKNKKLGKWIEKHEELVLHSIDRELEKYEMDFGPSVNTFLAMLAKVTTEELLFLKRTTATKAERGKTTIFMPEFAKMFLNDTEKMIEIANIDKFAEKAYANHSLIYKSETKPVETISTPDIKKFIKTTPKGDELKDNENRNNNETTTLNYYENILLNENFTFSKEHFERAYNNSHILMRNLSIFQIEDNYKLASKLMYENQFTTLTTTEYNSSEIREMFTKRYPNY